MFRRLRNLGIYLCCLLQGCATYPPPGATGCSPLLECVETARPLRPTQQKLLNHPVPQQKAVIAVYNFNDYTGQRKSSQQMALFSTAVTQGADQYLIDALKSAGNGNWFVVVERSGLDFLTRERQLIRQTRQTQLSKIGVVNVNTGVEQTYKTIAKNSQSIANDLAPFAQAEAEKTGVNTAKAISKQNLIDFDNTGSPNVGDENYNPNFGKPKAFAIPRDFGLVARSAYERVIERRFEESMQEELELKAIELSSDSKNSAEYNERFTNYLAAMDKAADGRFGEYIQNTGTAILRDSLLKLQIKEQEAAVKYAKKQSKENVFLALRKLSNSVGMADDPKSINEIMTLARNVTVAIEEDFALNQDKIEYVKNLDQIAFAKAGALTNLLSTSTANLSKSERLRIVGAFTNPALIKTIDSKITRQAIRKIIETSNGINLDKLSESFTKQVDGVDQIQKAEDTEYFSNNEDEFNRIITNAPFGHLVGKMTIELNKAPEESKEEVEQLFANAIGNAFISQLTSLESVQKL